MSSLKESSCTSSKPELRLSSLKSTRNHAREAGGRQGEPVRGNARRRLGRLVSRCGDRGDGVVVRFVLERRRRRRIRVVETSSRNPSIACHSIALDRIRAFDRCPRERHSEGLAPFSSILVGALSGTSGSCGRTARARAQGRSWCWRRLAPRHPASSHTPHLRSSRAPTTPAITPTSVRFERFAGGEACGPLGPGGGGYHTGGAAAFGSGGPSRGHRRDPAWNSKGVARAPRRRRAGVSATVSPGVMNGGGGASDRRVRRAHRSCSSRRWGQLRPKARRDPL